MSLLASAVCPLALSWLMVDAQVPMSIAAHAAAPAAASMDMPVKAPLPLLAGAPTLFAAQQALLENVREAERRLKHFNLKSEREQAAYLMCSEQSQQAQGFSIVGSMPMGPM